MTTEEPQWDEGANPFTLTLKGGKGYEEPWLVIRATSAANLRRQVMETFGIEGDGLTLAEVIHQASASFHAMSTLGSRLGATVIRSDSAAAAGGDDPWTQAQSQASEPATPADPNQALLDEIEAATTPDQLRRMWARENGEGRPFNDIVQAAWSAKGKSLQEGGN